MGYDESDDEEYSDYDEMGNLFILDEMDRKDEQMNGEGGCGTGYLSMVILAIGLRYEQT